MGLPLSHKNPKYHQGVYSPKNRGKYIGKDLPIFRSGLELKAFRFFDSNPNVIEWGSECVTVEYFDPVLRRSRTYFIDNYVKIKEGNIIKRYLVEIKPLKQTVAPKDTGKRKKAHLLYEQQQFATNSLGKWPAAREFAKKHGMEFIIITDKDLQ